MNSFGVFFFFVRVSTVFGDNFVAKFGYVSLPSFSYTYPFFLFVIFLQHWFLYIFHFFIYLRLPLPYVISYGFPIFLDVVFLQDFKPLDVTSFYSKAKSTIMRTRISIAKWCGGKAKVYKRCRLAREFQRSVVTTIQCHCNFKQFTSEWCKSVVSNWWPAGRMCHAQATPTTALWREKISCNVTWQQCDTTSCKSRTTCMQFDPSQLFLL